MLKSAKAKGYRFEVFVKDRLKAYGYEAQRTPLSGALDGWKGDITSKDFPFFIECKNCENTKFLEWYKKANDQTVGKPPVIFWTRNNEESYAFLSMDDFIMLTKGSYIAPQAHEKPKKGKKVEEPSNLPFSKNNQLAGHHRK